MPKDLTYQPSNYKDLGGTRTNIGGTFRRLGGATFLTEEGLGVVPAGLTKTTVKELLGSLHHTQITFSGQTVSIVDHTTAGAQVAVELYDFPSGNIHILGSECGVAIVASGTPGLVNNAAVVAAIGTVAVATTDATLTSTEANIIPSTTATLTAFAGTFAGKSTGASTFDGKTSALKAFLNIAVPDVGSSGNDTLTITGTINLVWINLGNS